MQNNRVNIKELIKVEYTKCLSEPSYFIKKYCYIQHPTKGRIKFNLYPFQEKVLEQFLKHDKNIILKSRQLGISTLTAAYALWLAMFHRDKNILVVAIKQEVAKNIITKCREMYAELPQWLKEQIKTDENNKLSIRFLNGSQIKAVSSTTDSGRSEALSLLIIDECAFISHIEELWASVQQTLATGGKAILLSTPNGVGNFFHRMWQKAEEQENGFNPIRLHWTVHPERDAEWRAKQTIELGEKLAAQECDCDFINSGHTVIEGSILQKYEKEIVKPPLERRGIDGELWIWERPNYTKSYIVAADVARGDGNDYSAFHVIDVETVEQVAEYRGKLPTKDYGNLLVNIATEYNDALLVIENSNIGWAAIQPAIDRDYKNLYYSHKDTMQVLNTPVLLQKGYDLRDKSQMVPGFTMSSRTRPMVISKLERYFREGECIVHSKRLIDELFVFIWANGRPEATSGYNDDLVMSFAIGLWVRDIALRLRHEGLELTKQSIALMTRTTSDYNQPIYSNGIQTDPWSMNVGKTSIDLRWLIK